MQKFILIGALVATLVGGVFVAQISADPQVWSTLVMPTFAPMCLGSAAMAVTVSASALNSSP